jgi:hypothetical protein
VVYEIDYKTVMAATHCTKGKRCLQQRVAAVCGQVHHCVMDKLLLVDCPDDKPCPYRHNIDHGHACSCPVRKEIFLRYGE